MKKTLSEYEWINGFSFVLPVTVSINTTTSINNYNNNNNNSNIKVYCSALLTLSLTKWFAAIFIKQYFT